MMSTAPYEKYKDSGVEWLGAVPEHWEVKRLKNSIEFERNGIWGNEPCEDENDLICVRVADFDRQNFKVGLDKLTVRNVSPSEQSGRVLQRGDLLLEKSGGGDLQPVGCVVLFDHEFRAVCSNFVARLKISANADAKFFVYVHATLYGIRLNVRSIKQTTGIQNLDARSYFEERIAFPPLPEQRAIASYLDRETARLDTLIARQQRMIELSLEKRRALISHAVTRGLDETAPLKDSGVDWLGQVPAHWEVKRLKYLVSAPLQYGASESSGQFEEGDPRFIRITDIREDGTLRDDSFCSLPTDIAQPFMLEDGDLLFARSGATVGKSFIYRSKFGPACFAGYLIRANIDKARTEPKFIDYFTSSSFYWEWLAGSSIQSTIQNVNAEKYNSLPIPIPPLPEQHAIAEYLDAETAKLDTLIEKARRAIELMKEHRSALIAAAVTGQIDVREHASAEYSARP